MSTLTIYPYLLDQTWVFDDERTGLKEEAFVLGMTEMISHLVEQKGIQDAAHGVTLHFCDEPFESFDAELTWLRSDDSQVVPGEHGSASQMWGNWYRGVVAGEQMVGYARLWAFISRQRRSGYSSKRSHCQRASIRSGTSAETIPSPGGSFQHQVQLLRNEGGRI